MIHAADVREWRNRDVVDAESHKIGVLEAIYVDTTTDEPAMATVRTGLPTRHRLVFVPIDNAIAGPGYLRVGYVRTLVKQAPSIGTDASTASHLGPWSGRREQAGYRAPPDRAEDYAAVQTSQTPAACRCSTHMARGAGSWSVTRRIPGGNRVVFWPAVRAFGPALLCLRRTYAPAGSTLRWPEPRRHRSRCRMVF